MKMQLIIAIGILLYLHGGFGARILGLFPNPAESHLSVTSPVMHALAKKGHDVTMFVPFHTGFNASNYREIVYKSVMPMPDRKAIQQRLMMNFVVRQLAFYNVGTLITEMALNTDEARALIKSDEKYDLVMMEQFVNEALFVYAHKFQCPVVLLSAIGATNTINNIFGNSAPHSYVPTEFSGFGDRMTFSQRLENVLTILFAGVTRKFYYMPQQQALAEKYLSESGISIPPLEELERQADFILLNSHQAFSTPRPYMPNMKNVGGMHLKPSKPLPQDLQQYLDSSKNGTILLSFGSAIQGSQMPDHVIQALNDAFSRLPYDVLWKWENDTMANQPKNVRIEKWLPQNDILAHRNVKLFVTHGGISSIMETVYHGVPIVGIPVFGDQQCNVRFAGMKGYAEHLDFRTMIEHEVYNAIIKVITDPKYQQNVRKVSAYWRDEMNHPLDEAIHWVEYVIKHGGAKHLKAAVTEQNFIQYLLLDVVLTILLALAVIYFSISKSFKLLCRKSSAKKNPKKTN